MISYVLLTVQTERQPTARLSSSRTQYDKGVRYHVYNGRKALYRVYSIARAYRIWWYKQVACFSFARNSANVQSQLKEWSDSDQSSNLHNGQLFIAADKTMSSFDNFIIN